MRIAIPVIFLAGLAILPPGIAPAQAAAPATQPAPPALLQSLQRQLQSVQTVQADFVQEKHLAMLDHTLIIRGRFALQRPDRVIWIVQSPLGYAISVHGDQVRQWDQDSNQVQTIHLGDDPTFKAITDQIHAWFLGDYQTLAQSYDIWVQSRDPLCLAFAPKPATLVAKLIDRVTVTFSGDRKYIQSMQIRQAGGDRTTLSYSHTQLNKAIPPETWEIPPHGH
jgi:outer membrane lipoprotein-sorting protein